MMDEEERFAETSNDEPGVINIKMLERLATEQGAKGEAGKLFLQDGVKLDEIKEIRIEFLNILRIDSLWMMTSLTRLKLSNNAIDKIENLDNLVNLTELDLSFNHIGVIENLHCLVKLEILLLYANDIREIGGIEALTKLTILSIGANRIETWDHVLYLRQFKELRTLNVAGNICTKQDDYYDYLLAFLPRLTYMNYKMPTEEERNVAHEKHQRAIANLEEKEAIEKTILEEKRAAEERLALLALSYVEYLEEDELFQQMYNNDKDGKELSGINEETRTAYEEYRRKFIALCLELYEFGLRQQVRRSEEIKLFEKIVDEGREAIHKNARAMIYEVMERKNEIFEKFEMLLNVNEEDNARDDDIEEKIEKVQALSNDFNDLLEKNWSDLMYKEVLLHEQIEDTNETFKLSMGDLVTAFLETARTIFGQMRNAEAEYNDDIDRIVTTYINDFTDPTKMPIRHIEICGDKDILTNNLATSHDLHLQTIDAREDLMSSRVKNWYENFMDRIAREEYERNRCQILEISQFFEYQREEFDVLQLQFRSGNDPLDGGIVPAMNG